MIIGNPTFNQTKTRKSNPRAIAVFFLIVGIFFTIFLGVPISLVFNREWKLNQKVDIAQDVYIDYQKLGISSITDRFGFDREVPIGNISIRFYAICILAGLLAGYFLALHLAKSQYIAGTIIDRLIIGLIIFGLLGARLFYVAFRWDFFSANPHTVFTEILKGGLAFFGMLLFGIIYLWLYCKRFKFNFFEFADLLSPAVLLGQVLGRWGNFFNYESYGPQTSVYWKMYVPPSANFTEDLNAEFFHPTFLYEIIPNFILLIFILWNYEKITEKRSGIIFSYYAMGYGIIRFITEFFRRDALKVFLPTYLRFEIGVFNFEYLLISQLSALILFIFGFYVWWKRRTVIYIKKNMSEFKTN